VKKQVVLRGRAEALLKKKRVKTTRPRADANARKQLHALQISRIELEMQNSALMELQVAKGEIQAGLARYADLYDFAPIGYFTLDRNGILQEVNLTGANLLGLVRSRLVGRRLASFVSVASLPDFAAFLAKVFASDARQNCELGLITADQRAICVRIEANADESGQTCRAVLEDISARKSTAEALRRAHEELESKVLERTAALARANEFLRIEIAERKQAEETLRNTQHILTIAQRVAHVGSWEMNVVTGELQCSDEFFRICGLEPGSVKPSLALAVGVVHPDDRETVKKAISATYEEGKEFKIENRIIRPDGSIRYVRSQGEVIHNDEHELMLVVGSFLDITEYKKVETALMQSRKLLRDLAAHEERIKEEERKRIAREVHDELGGLLTGIKAYLSVAVDQAERAGVAADPSLVDASNLANSAIETVRRVITDLRPSVLDQLGVWSALEWYVDQIQERTGLRCDCTIDAATTATAIDPERSIALFRIVQEALTNVVRHAKASRVSIRATRHDDSVLVEVEDNGRGIETERLLNRESWGIVGMHERASYFGGELKITGSSGYGTVVALRVPMKETDD